MAQNSDLERRMCLVWQTEKPYSNKHRISSDFSLLGSEWNLQLGWSCCGRERRVCYDYTLSLHQGTEIRNLKESLQFHVSAFIENHNKLPVLGQSKKIQTTNEVLFRYDGKNISNNSRSFETCGKIKIICIFHDFSSSTTFHTKNETIHLSTCMGISSDLENLSLDCCKLLEQEIFPDAKLKCGDRITPVHRSILAARSEVFSAMFRNKMIESETGIVDITDLDAPVLDLLLKYVYSGKVPDFSHDTASSLYAASDKYAIHALKRACSDWMIRNLSEENCLASLILADTHSDKNFKDDVTNFMSEHLQVLRTLAWFKFCEEHPRLANIVYQKCFALSFAM